MSLDMDDVGDLDMDMDMVVDMDMEDDVLEKIDEDGRGMMRMTASRKSRHT